MKMYPKDKEEKKPEKKKSQLINKNQPSFPEQ
jgi:hypothetical protein